MLHHFRRMSGLATACALAFALLLLAAQAALAETAAAPAAAAPGVAAGSIAQAVFGLAVVLALVGCAAWLLKRFSGMPGTGTGLIRIIGGASVGQRERIILVEVAGTWLVLGVAPGQVRALHTMPRTESAAAPEAPARAEAGFAARLRRMTERRAHGQ